MSNRSSGARRLHEGRSELVTQITEILRRPDRPISVQPSRSTWPTTSFAPKSFHSLCKGDYLIFVVSHHSSFASLRCRYCTYDYAYTYGSKRDVIPRWCDPHASSGFCHCILNVSEVAEDLLSLVPVHRGRSLLVAAGEGILLCLGSCRAQSQATVHERVWNTPVVLIRHLQHTQTHTFVNTTHSATSHSCHLFSWRLKPPPLSPGCSCLSCWSLIGWWSLEKTGMLSSRWCGTSETPFWSGSPSAWRWGLVPPCLAVPWWETEWVGHFLRPTRPHRPLRKEDTTLPRMTGEYSKSCVSVCVCVLKGPLTLLAVGVIPSLWKSLSVSWSTMMRWTSSPPALMRATTSECLRPSMFTPFTWDREQGDVRGTRYRREWTN